MGKKLNRVYEALIEGASEGLADDRLYNHVTTICPKTSSKRIVRAALLALTDPDVNNRKVLEVIYALAIKYRLSSLGIEYDALEDDEDDAKSPSVTHALKARLESSVAEIAPLDGAL